MCEELKMITMLILFVVTCLLGIILWVCNKISECTLAGFCLLAAMVFILIPSITQSTILSYGLTPSKNFIDGQLYYDEKADKYYAIYSDENWKFWDLYEKVEVPNDIAKEKIESAKINEIISK